MRPGSLMLITDHLNFSQRSPLFGEPGNERFVDMVNAYDAALREQARAAAHAKGTALHSGVYAWFMGPQFETPAEIRMFKLLGAQAVGMSTVPETILARHAGMKVLAISLMTNMAAGMQAEALSHAHTMATAAAASERAVAVLTAVVQHLKG
jgi:purine-nucleoside phosphorylase